MSRMYGWGASIVIIGALFKIMHWPFADLALIVGMGVEAVVFFFSAFEQVHEEPDWSLVYPELAGIEGHIPFDQANRRGVPAASNQNITLSANLDKLLEEADIGPELINNLGRGLRNLSDNASKLAEISNAAVATDQYIQNMESASKSVLELSQSYKNASEYLKHDLSLSQEYGASLQNAVTSMNQVSETYQQTAQTAKENLKASEELNTSMRNVTVYNNQLGESYSKNAELLTKAVEALESSAQGGQTFNTELHKTAQNLSALNAAYELQLQAATTQSDSTEKLQKTVGALVENMSDSLADTQQYKQEMEKLNSNIRALNNVYGNMLSAMNFNVNK